MRSGSRWSRARRARRPAARRAVARQRPSRRSRACCREPRCGGVRRRRCAACSGSRTARPSGCRQAPLDGLVARGRRPRAAARRYARARSSSALRRRWPRHVGGPPAAKSASRGMPHRLIVMTDVQHALRAEERQAWQRLVRVLGHEINNSLGPISSIAETLRTGLARPSGRADFDDDLQRGLEVIERRAAALARFMQSYARLVRLPPPKVTRVDVATWIDRTVALETRLKVVNRRRSRDHDSRRPRSARPNADQPHGERGRGEHRDGRHRTHLVARRSGRVRRSSRSRTKATASPTPRTCSYRSLRRSRRARASASCSRARSSRRTAARSSCETARPAAAPKL